MKTLLQKWKDFALPKKKKQKQNKTESFIKQFPEFFSHWDVNMEVKIIKIYVYA
jgi:hypothetical protein